MKYKKTILNLCEKNVKNMCLLLNFEYSMLTYWTNLIFRLGFLLTLVWYPSKLINKIPFAIGSMSCYTSDGKITVA